MFSDAHLVNGTEWPALAFQLANLQIYPENKDKNVV
jgi:hypothetical protein